MNCNFHIHSNEKTRTNLQHHKYYYGLHEFETNWINGWHFGGYDQKGKVIDEMNPLNMRIRMVLMTLALPIAMHIYNIWMVNGTHISQQLAHS